MLSSLHIENIAVIKNIDIEFSCGFNVLTGETGAGKSIVIDSINLLRGSRVDRELVRSGESSAFVGALFSELSEEVLSSLACIDIFPDENGEIYIQRTIFADGKSNAKINGRSISASLLKSITPFLLAIHGQNENQMLANDDSNIALLDKYSGLDAELGEYRKVFQTYVEVSNEIKELTRDESERIRTLEMLNYQIADIEAAKLKPSEEEKLLDKKVKIKNIERITKQLNFADKALKGSEKSNACYILDRTISALESISDVVSEASRIKDMLSEAYSVIEDAAELVYDMTDDECGDPEKALDEIESRLDVIHKLKKKYGPDVESIIRYKEDAIRKKEALDSADDRIAQLENKKKSILKELNSRALDLHSKRVTASSEMSEKVCKNLVFLDMPKVKFDICVLENKDANEYVYDKNGIDKVSFVASTNVGEPQMPISKIASGGELARMMLSLKNVIAERDAVQTLIFDEVDTGVSGKTARKIGINLLMAGRSAQVICVTHSAQIASLADSHLLIKKDDLDGRVYTNVISLDEDGRVSELARILGGIDVTDIQRAAAKELMAEKSRYTEA